jgi:hypothetical protein
MLIGSATGSIHAAAAAPVPEIDASSVSAGLALVTGGVMILRSRIHGRR